MGTEDDLWPVAQRAAQALTLGAKGDIEGAWHLFESLLRSGEAVFFSSLCGWAATLCPPTGETTKATVLVVGPQDSVHERASAVGAMIAGVLNEDVDGVLALWRGLSRKECVQVGCDVFATACAVARAVSS